MCILHVSLHIHIEPAFLKPQAQGLAFCHGPTTRPGVHEKHSQRVHDHSDMIAVDFRFKGPLKGNTGLL